MTRAATAEPASRKSGKSVSFRVDEGGTGGSKGGEEGDNADPTMVRVDDGFDDDSLPSDEEGELGDFSVDNNRFNRSVSAPEQWEERADRYKKRRLREQREQRKQRQR